jgi:hypothetical protein
VADFDGALASIEESILIYGRLATDSPREYLPEVATSLRHKAKILKVLGRYKDAQATADEATAIDHKLDHDRSGFRPDLL